VVTFAIVMLKKEVPIKNVFSNLLSTYVWCFPPWFLEFRSLRKLSPNSESPGFLVREGCGPWIHPEKRCWGLQSSAVSWLWCYR
jgi:hypothetical protein